MNLSKCPMPGQLVTYVPAEVHKQASGKTGPRGLKAIFIGFYEAHGKIDSSGLLIPLEPLLSGVGSISPVRTKDYKIPSEASFPFNPSSRVELNDKRIQVSSKHFRKRIP